MRSRAQPLIRPGSRWTFISFLVVVAGAALVPACGSDAVKQAAVRELAVGSWDCVPDAPGAGEMRFTVEIDNGGAFVVSFDQVSVADDVRPAGSIPGTWAIKGGDLEWGFDDFMTAEKSLIEGFESLTLESTGFTLQRSGILEPNDGTDDPPEEQAILVDAHSADAVTLSVPGGDPWTCSRQ